VVSAREEILARVRTALQDGPTPAPPVRDYRTADHAADLDTQQLLELLTDRLVDYRALVRRSTTTPVAEMVTAALNERGAHRVVVPDGLPPQWLDRLEPGVELVGDSRRSPPPNWTPSTASSPAARSPSPRPAPSSWTAHPTRAAAGSPSSPTTTSVSCGSRTRSSPPSHRRSNASTRPAR